MKIDGATNEEVWAKAQAITDFLQRDPNEGQKPTHQTEARVAYDSNYLYVAVRADEPEPDVRHRAPDRRQCPQHLRHALLGRHQSERHEFDGLSRSVSRHASRRCAG